MKQKILAGIATSLIVMAGVITPVFGFVMQSFQVKHAAAQCTGTPCLTNPTTTYGPEPAPNQVGVPYADPTAPYLGPGGGPNNQGSSIDPSASSTIGSVGDGGDVGGQATGQQAECGPTEFGCQIMSAVASTITSVPFFLASLAGLVSDYAIWYSLQSSTYTQYDGGVGDEGIVVKGWKLVRDFSNLLFIFALFVIAFTLILNLDERGDGAPMGLDPKRTIARVIIMALLVNFSFFLGRSVIDVTNIVALSFYNKISVAPKINSSDNDYTQNAQQDVTSFYENAFGIRSISTGIIGQINPQRFILAKESIKASDGSYGALFFIAIMSAVFGLFLVYLFLSIAILFISRTIGLFLAIIISPIAFVSYTIPALQKQSFIGFDDWLKQFFGLAFMGPVFLFFLYISLQFFKISLVAGSGLITMAAQVLVQFLIVGILLIYAKNVAKDLSGKMGEMTTNAITSVATGAAVVAGVAATGGVSGLARFGGQRISQGLGTAADSLGKSAFGEDRYAAMQKQWKINGGAVKNFTSNPGSAWRGITKVMRAGETEPSVISRFTDSYKQGQFSARREDMNKAKEAADKEKAKKTKAIDVKIDKLKKQLADEPWNKEKINEELRNLTQEKKSVTNPTATVEKKIADLNKKLTDLNKNPGRLPPAELAQKKEIIQQDIKIAEAEKNKISTQATIDKLESDVKRSGAKITVPIIGDFKLMSSSRKDKVNDYINRVSGPENVSERGKIETQLNSLRMNLADIETLDKNPDKADPTNIRGTGSAVKEQIKQLEARKQKLIEQEGLKEKIGNTENKIERLEAEKHFIQNPDATKTPAERSQDLLNVITQKQATDRAPIPPRIRTKITEAEMKNFVDTGHASDDMVNFLANKIRTNQVLDANEMAVYQSHSQRIEDAARP